MAKNIALGSLVYNRPLALLPSHLAVLTALARDGGDIAAILGEKADCEDRDYDVVAGIAVIPIKGDLMHSPDWWWWGYSTSYRQIRRCLASAIGDDMVKAIVLHVDSPGGECSGCFDMADAIYAMRGTKPIWAIVDEACFSAAYALASAADKIMIPRTGGVGSIGIIAQHTSIVGALEKAGIEVTTFTYGARKADGWPTSKMTDPAANRIQAEIDALGELFVDTVARNRDIAASKIRAMEAGTFMGSAGVSAGLADKVISVDEAFLEMLDTIA